MPDPSSQGMGHRIRALWISSDFWDKPGTGGRYYSQSVLKAFSHSATVEIIKIVPAPWPALSTTHKALGLAQSLVSRGSTFRSTCTSPVLLEALSNPAFFEGIDAVILNGSDQFRAVAKIPDAMPLIYVMHDLQRDYLKQSISALPRWQQIVLGASREAEKCVREEEGLLRRASVVIGISMDELEEVQAAHPRTATVWLPPTFDAPAARPARDLADRVAIGMVGALDHYPNRVALEFFLREAWPFADARAHLVLAGKGTERFTDQTRRVDGLGHIQEINAFWEQIDILAAPIALGSGTNVKVCEALAHQLPLLASPFAMRGLGPLDDAAIRLAKSVDDWRLSLGWEPLLALARSHPSSELAARFNLADAVPRLDEALQALANTRVAAPFRREAAGAAQALGNASPVASK